MSNLDIDKGCSNLGILSVAMPFQICYNMLCIKAHRIEREESVPYGKA